MAANAGYPINLFEQEENEQGILRYTYSLRQNLLNDLQNMNFHHLPLDPHTHLCVIQMRFLIFGWKNTEIHRRRGLLMLPCIHLVHYAIQHQLKESFLLPDAYFQWSE